MATLHYPQARVFALILTCLAPSLDAIREQKSLDGPAGCAPLLAAARDARAAQGELSSLLQVASKDPSLDAKKLNRTLFFASKRWVERLRVQMRRAHRECSLPEGLLKAYRRGGGTGEEEEEGRGERGENEVGMGSRREWRLQVLSQNPDKAHKRETDPEERAGGRERGRDAASEARREMLTIAANYRGRGISERSLTKLLAKILTLDATLEEHPGGGDGQEPAFEDDPRPRLEIDEEEVLHEVPRTFLSLALGSSLIQHHWKKFYTKSPLLLTLTRALSPAVLRMGGSSANFLTYDPKARSQVSRGEEEEEEEETMNEEVTNGKEKEIGINGEGEKRGRKDFDEEEGKGRDERTNEIEEEVKEREEEEGEEEEEEGEEYEAGKEYDEGDYEEKEEEEEEEEKYEDGKEYDEGDYEEEEEEEEEEGGGGEKARNSAPRFSDLKKPRTPKERENENELADLECGSNRQVFANFTMTGRDWRILQDFARDVGMSLLFDVSQFRRRDDGSWDSANARLIVRDVEGGGGPGDVLWQLGNEPNAYNHKFSLRITPNQTAEDYLLLRQELDRRFPQAGVVGPDITRPKKMNRKLALKMSSVDYLASFLSTVKINLTAVTWHQYYVNGRTATLEKFQSPEVFDQLVWQVEAVVRVRNQLSPSTPVWLTETSSAWGGGAPGLSNAFAGGFLWLDKLGVAARGGISLVARQTLYDGCYALLDQDLNPYPVGLADAFLFFCLFAGFIGFSCL